MKDYETLKNIIDEIDNLINHHVRSSAPAFRAWHTKAERFLIKKYGEKDVYKRQADAQHFPKLPDGHDVRIFRKHHLIKLCLLYTSSSFVPLTTSNKR